MTISSSSSSSSSSLDVQLVLVAAAHRVAHVLVAEGLAVNLEDAQ